MKEGLIDHNLVPGYEYQSIIVEKRPARTPDGKVVEELNNTWIFLNNPKELNSYTTQAVKEIILALREASNDRSCVAIVLTAVGDRSFCTGGNTREYAEYYAGRPLEYKQYMRLFNDMITTLLTVDKPVINRVNGMRIAGGQEIGMACDFSISSDLAVFGQAGPRHGSAPDGGSTDFLHLYVGFANGMESATLCRTWSAYKALRLGLLNKVVPVLRENDRFIPNPMVITDRWLDEMGQIVYGEFKTGSEYEAAKEKVKTLPKDFSLLDQAVEEYCSNLLMLMPDCLAKTIESVRKKKLEHWQRNCETNRSWLALNMMTEAKAGFRAFNEGPKGNREVDFVKLRTMLAEGHPWDDDLIRAISPQYQQEK